MIETFSKHHLRASTMHDCLFKCVVYIKFVSPIMSHRFKNFSTPFNVKVVRVCV